MQAPINDPGFQPFGARSHRLAQMASPETRDAFLQKAVAPEFDGVDATRLVATDCCQSLPARQTKDDPNTSPLHRPAGCGCGLCVLETLGVPTRWF